jgi:UDP-N-acetylmuramyl pentapeptide phosphotransferase/UDP-N-acetylglucosamine-1-phosphate transferase
MNIDRYPNPKMDAIRIIRVIIAGTISFLGGWFTVPLSNWSRLLAPIVFLVLIFICGYLAAGGIGTDRKTRNGNMWVGNAWAVSLFILGLWISFGISSKGDSTNIIPWLGLLPFFAYFLVVSVWLWRTIQSKNSATENKK